MVKYSIMSYLQYIISTSTCTAFELFTSLEQLKLITTTKLKQNNSYDELCNDQAEGHFTTS